MGTLLIPSLSTILGSMKFSVAPLSSRASYAADFFVLVKIKGTSSVLFFAIQQIYVVWARITAAEFEPSKNPLVQSSRPLPQ
jgi:hypothetical protein